MTPKLIRGWLWALFSVLVLWGCNNVMIAYSAQLLQANYLIYTCCAFVSCAFFLLLAGGKGALVKETLRSVDTWAFGLIMLLGYILTLSLFSYVTSTEGSLLQRISLIFGIVLSWLFLSRAPTKGQIIGAIIVFIGIFMVCQGLPEENKGIIYFLMFLEGLALTGRMFVAEIHRPHQQAINLEKDPRAKARVVGFVMFVMSTFFLVMTALIAVLQTYAPLPVEIDLLPTIDDFTHAPSILAGLFAGVVLLVPLRLIEFSSANTIKTENFLALAALSSISTYFWEWVLQPITGMSLKTFTGQDMLAGGIITIGCLVAAISVAIKSSKKESNWENYLKAHLQNPEQVSDSREILANALEHYDGDTKKAAAALDVPVGVVNAMLADKDKILAFRTSVLKKVARNYRHNIATSDSLTGLTNRAGFMTELKEEINKGQELSILYIDLNKFKPINDTYGHQAGDEALRITAERMISGCKANSTVARLGGDEFAIMLLDTSKDQVKEVQTRMLKAMEADIKLEDGTVVNLSASFGSVTYPEDGTDAEELLELADKAMYQVKQGR
jgi:diguanylate cyclase (GGDEF)-like protein